MNPYLFIRIPRTASTSICEALELENWHETALERKEKLGSEFDSKFKFTIVRHPFERFLSGFYFLSIFGTQEYLGEPRDPNKFLQETDLAEFTKNDFNNFIMKPQTDYILDELGNSIVDFIGRYENLEKDWATICEALGVPTIPLPIRAKSTEQKATLNQSSQDILREFYKKDFDFLNYN